MVEIDRYRDADFSEVLSLFRETVHQINAADYNSQQIEAWAPEKLDEKRWGKLLSRNLTLLAVDNGRILGFTALSKTGNIEMLFVHKDHQGSQIGSSLLEAIERTARKHNLKKLTSQSSITALPFFEKKGFVIEKKQIRKLRGVQLVNFQVSKLL